MVPLFHQLCPIPCRIFHKLTPRRKDHLRVSVPFVRFLILGAYRDVECGARVAPSGQEFRWAQPRAWDEPQNLRDGCRGAGRRRFVTGIGDIVMAASGLSQRAARGMHCTCVQQAWRGGDSGCVWLVIGGQDVMVQHVPIDAHAVQDLRDRCHESDEHGLGGGMVHAQAGLAQDVAGLHRFFPLGH